MPIQLFYKLQMIDVKEHQSLFSLPVVKEAVKKHIEDAYKLIAPPAQSSTTGTAGTAPSTGTTASSIGCVSYHDYVFSFPICWFRAFFLMMCLPNRIAPADLEMPTYTEDPQLRFSNIHNRIYDFGEIQVADKTLKPEIEMLLYYILTNYHVKTQDVDTYRFKDDVLMMLLRLLHAYKPQVYTNPGFYGDFVYYYPINIFKDFDVFNNKNKNMFHVIDRRKIKNNQTAPTIPKDKKHVFVMYKYNQPINMNISGYGVSAIYMLNYNMFKLKNAFNNHAICIYHCPDDQWYTNELSNEVSYGAETGKLDKFDLSSQADIPQSNFHKRFNLKFNIHKGCRIVHYVIQDNVTKTTNSKIQSHDSIQFFSLTQLLVEMMRKTTEYKILINAVIFEYKYEIDCNGYKHTLKVRKTEKTDTYFFKVSRSNLTFRIEEYVNRVTEPINMADLDRILVAERLSLIGMCNKAIHEFGLDPSNHTNDKSTVITVETPNPNMVTLEDKRKAVRQYNGGGKSTTIVYKNKTYKVRKDADTKLKYIIRKNQRLYLSSIRGKYRYHM